MPTQEGKQGKLGVQMLRVLGGQEVRLHNDPTQAVTRVTGYQDLTGLRRQSKQAVESSVAIGQYRQSYRLGEYVYGRVLDVLVPQFLADKPLPLLAPSEIQRYDGPRFERTLSALGEVQSESCQ